MSELEDDQVHVVVLKLLMYYGNISHFLSYQVESVQPGFYNGPYLMSP